MRLCRPRHLFVLFMLLPLVAEARWYTQPVAGRAVFAQEERKSCALAGARMVVHTMTGQNLPESHFRSRSACYPGCYDPNVGTPLTNIAHLLRERGIDASFEYRDIDGLQRAVAGGNPALVSVRTTTGHHALVVDAMSGPRGNRDIYVRDPAGCCCGMSESEFRNDYVNESVVCYGAACDGSRGRPLATPPAPQRAINPGPVSVPLYVTVNGPNGPQRVQVQISIRLGQSRAGLRRR